MFLMSSVEEGTMMHFPCIIKGLDEFLFTKHNLFYENVSI